MDPTHITNLIYELETIIDGCDYIELELSGGLSGTLEHEINHIKNNDALRGLMASLSIPAITAIGFCLLKLKPRGKPSAWWKHLTNNLLSGLALNCINIATYRHYKKRREQKADDSIGTNDTPENAIVTLRDYEKILAYEIEEEKNGANIQSFFKKLFKAIKSLDPIKIGNFLSRAHPTHEVRLAKIRERRKKLKLN